MKGEDPILVVLGAGDLEIKYLTFLDI